MTVIVGIATDTHMYIGGDRGVSDGKYIESMLEPKVSKHGKMLFGYAGNIGLGQLISNHFIFPQVVTASDVHSVFIPSLRTFIKDHELSPKEDDEAESMLCAAGRVWTINLYDYQVLPFTMTSIGSGAGVALGSLFSSHGTIPNRVQHSIEAACTYVTTCQLPVDVLSVKY